MQLRIAPPNTGWLRVVCVALVAGIAMLVLFKPLVQVSALVLGAAVLCLVVAPITRLYERKLPRSLSTLLGLLTAVLALTGLGWLLLPAMLRELASLARALPDSVRQLAGWAATARELLRARLPDVTLPEINLGALEGALSGMASGAIAVLSNAAGFLGDVSMMAVLAYFFLCDRENLLLRLELLLPQSIRHLAVRMASGVCRELRLYLRAQLIIAGAVGVLAAVALSLVGVRSAIALGLIIGLFNMIPYFGPFIGGVPAVLIALGDSWQKAVLTIVALSVVQQLDGAMISPRIMGSVTGFSPALVLVGIYAVACVGGIAGMLFALPAMVIVRTLFRVFVQKYENI